jgi:protein-L-isoaspartate(D-aspartate) O-methyltransferase
MDAVSRAFVAVPRAGFLPPEERWHASYDGPIPIGLGQTNSQPRTVADMLRLLDVHPGQRVLDVGAGSGWTTALLAHLTGPTGRVTGVELEPSLVAFGTANLATTHQPWATILVSAEALSLPLTLVDQLVCTPEHPGRMVVPVAGEMLLVVRAGPAEEDLEVTRHGWYRFVPLR